MQFCFISQPSHRGLKASPSDDEGIWCVTPISHLVRSLQYFGELRVGRLLAVSSCLLNGCFGLQNDEIEAPARLGVHATGETGDLWIARELKTVRLDLDDDALDSPNRDHVNLEVGREFGKLVPLRPQDDFVPFGPITICDIFDSVVVHGFTRVTG